MSNELRMALMLVAMLVVGILDFAAIILAIAMAIDGDRPRRFSLQAIFFVMTLVALNTGVIAAVVTRR